MNNADMTAYPTMKKCGEIAESTGGLTKREYFAAMAMQGMLANQYVSDFNGQSPNDPKLLPVRALKYADALLKELDK